MKCQSCGKPIRVDGEGDIWIHDDGFANCEGIAGVLSGKLLYFAEPTENAPHD